MNQINIFYFFLSILAHKSIYQIFVFAFNLLENFLYCGYFVVNLFRLTLRPDELMTKAFYEFLCKRTIELLDNLRIVLTLSGAHCPAIMTHNVTSRNNINKSKPIR